MNIRSVFGIVNPQFAAAGSLNFPPDATPCNTALLCALNHCPRRRTQPRSGCCPPTPAPPAGLFLKKI